MIMATGTPPVTATPAPAPAPTVDDNLGGSKKPGDASEVTGQQILDQLEASQEKNEFVRMGILKLQEDKELLSLWFDSERAFLKEIGESGIQ